MVEYFGGPETAGFGFGLGLERLLLVLDKQGIKLPVEESLDVYIAVLGSGANGKALELVQSLDVRLRHSLSQQIPSKPRLLSH